MLFQALNRFTQRR